MLILLNTRSIPFLLTAWSICLALALASVTMSSKVLAEDGGRWAVSDTSINACRTIQNRVDRLSCFDALFKTPSTIGGDIVQATSSTVLGPGPITRLIEDVDRARPGPVPPIHHELRPWQTELRLSQMEFDGFLARQAKPLEPSEDVWSKRTLIEPIDYAPDTVDVFLVTRSLLPEAGVPQVSPLGARALMMMSCENDITRLALRLPEPIAERRIQVELRTASGGKLGVWQSLENGHIVTAGRGLESIGLIAGMIGHKRVQAELITDEQVYPFFFDIDNLGEVIGALRTACHW